MSIKKDASRRHSVQVEIEVPGTPEEVWQAIATGPGVSSWFVPTEVREDGTVVSHFGPGMDAVASTDDWDNQLENFESGWPWFLRILRLYLTHFGGQRCSAFRVMGVALEPESRAWESLTGRLGLTGATMGQRRNTPAGVPPLAGLIERIGEGGHPHGLLLRLDEPVPGIVSLFAHTMGGPVLLVIDFYLYGDRAAATALSDEPLWHAWMKERFPSVGDASDVA